MQLSKKGKDKVSGTTSGGYKAAETNKQRYGSKFYTEIGKEGGSVKHPHKGFGNPNKGADGLTGRERASQVGSRGGKNSKRPSHKVAVKLMDHYHRFDPRRWIDK